MTIKRPKSSKDRIVLALDVDSIDEVEEIVKELKEMDCKKIELFLARLLRLQDMSIKKLDTILEYS